MSQIISNNLTRQGTPKDVAANFDINNIPQHEFTPDQLRGISAASWLCYKVIAHIPDEMVNVAFSMSLTGQSGKAKSNQDMTIIQEQMRRLMPWFGEAQKRANIVGKSYLLIQAMSVDPINFEIDSLETPEEAMVPEEAEDMTQVFSPPVYADNTRNTPTTEKKSKTNIEKIKERFPHSLPIEWSDFTQVQVSGVTVLYGDLYRYDNHGRFLMRITPGTTKDVIESGKIDVGATLNKWYKEDPEGDSNQWEIIHHSRVIEFKAFDYQEAVTEGPQNSKIDLSFRKKKCSGNQTAFRFTRFLSALLYYDSFINATLNRAHRSEFISYQKENLGDTNLEIARAAAAMPSHPSVAATIIDPEQAIEDELTNISNSAFNLGVVMTDVKSNMNLLSRSFSGLNNVHDIFRIFLVGASGLTEFILLGVVASGSAGLNGQDVRDRMAIATQVDVKFRDLWQPRLEELANYIALSYQSFPSNAYIAVKPSTSFKLTELEIADVLDKMVDTRIKLMNAGVMYRAEVRSELKGDGLLGKYFNLTQPDKATIKEVMEILDQLDENTALTSNGTNQAKPTPAPVVSTPTTNTSTGNAPQPKTSNKTATKTPNLKGKVKQNNANNV